MGSWSQEACILIREPTMTHVQVSCRWDWAVCKWAKVILTGGTLWAQQQGRLVHRRKAAADSKSRVGFLWKAGFLDEVWVCCSGN